MALRNRETAAAVLPAQAPSGRGADRKRRAMRFRRAGRAVRPLPRGAFEAAARAGGAAARGDVPARVRRAVVSRNRRYPGQDGKLGARNVLSRQGTAEKGDDSG